LLAPAYNVWSGPATLGTNPTCFYGGSPPTNAEDPFNNTDANDEWSSVSGTTLTTWWIGESVGANNIGADDKIALPTSTANQLTGAIDATKPPSQTANVGAVQPYFDQTYLSQQALPVNPRQTPPAYDSGCMAHTGRAPSGEWCRRGLRYRVRIS
jgi:hypothetical protein